MKIRTQNSSTKMISLIVLLLLFFLFAINTSVYAAEENLVSNPGFEAEDEEFVWKPYSWNEESGVSEFAVDEARAYSGSRSARITNHDANDARYIQTLLVEPETYYRFSGWVMVDNLEGDKGANLTLEGITETSLDLKEKLNDWQYIEVYILTSSNQKEIAISIRLGGYGNISKGSAWFDDIEVVKVESLPQGARLIELQNNETQGSNNQEIRVQKDPSWFMYVYLVIFAMICVLLIRHRKSKLFIKMIEYKYSIIIFLVGTVLLKIYLAPIVEGFPNDIGCFRSWSFHASQDLLNFYTGGFFCDYPPLYIYVLSFVGKIINLFNLDYSSTAALVLIKLPSIIAESVTAYLIYSEAKKNLKSEVAFILSLAYVLNPAVVLNSTIWGQVDAFFSLIIVIMVMMVKRERITDAAMLLALAILMKPHGLIFGPVLLIEIIRRKDIKLFIQSFITGLLTIILVIIPFSLNQSPFWILRLYISTADGYKYASMNAFNFFALIGANLRTDSDTLLLFSYGTWGYIFIILVTLLITFAYIKSKKHFIIPLTTIGIHLGVFMFSSRMHERYLFVILPLLLFAYIYYLDQRLLLIFFGFTITIFINMQVVLSRMLTLNYPHIPSNNLIMLIFSFINLVLMIYYIKIIKDLT